MQDILKRVDLRLSQLLLLSMSVLWYPLGGEDGYKAHHLVMILLFVTSTAGGEFVAFMHASLRRAPLLYFALIGWFLTLAFTTYVFPTHWSAVKITSFFVQVVMGNYAAYRIVRDRGVEGLKRPLNISLVLFVITFFGLSGVPLQSITDIFIRSVVNANPSIIIFEFLARAPLFQSFSEDGLDGLRHTISLYLLLVLLVNIIQLRTKLDKVISFGLLMLVILLQSRSAWLALLGPAFAFALAQARQMSGRQWLLAVIFVPTLLAGLALTLGPIILARVSESDSYEGRFDRLTEAFTYLQDLSLEPITMFREYISPHMFIFDSYYSGGLVAFIMAALFVWRVALECLPRGTIKFEPHHLGFVLAFPFLIRLFTAGSGLPGIGASFAFSVALVLNAMPRNRQAR